VGNGPARRDLLRLREDYPISVHGVGLSLGSAGRLDARHLERLADLVDRVEPAAVSEHLSWSVAGGAYLNHLLPLPLTQETLAVVTSHVDQIQRRLRRRLLVENPSSYLRFTDSTMSEARFLAELVRRTGCGLLCDVNNVYVSAHNVGFDAVAYLDELPASAVGEVHLAGHAINDADGRRVLIDDHGGQVAEAVWALFAHVIARFGPVPTLIEWDTNVPALDVLLHEATRAQAALDRAGALDRAAGGAHADAA